MARITTKADFKDYPYLSIKLTKARRIKKRLPKPLPWVNGVLNVFYLEIAEALLFGLNHGAITLSGGFCEHLFRLCLHERKTEYQRDKKIDEALWKKLSEKTLTSLLKEGEKSIPIPKDDHEWWVKFSKKTRNSYVHFRIFDILKNEKELACDASTGEEFELSVQSNKEKWAMAKKLKDEEMALFFFSELTEVVLKIFNVMRWKEKEPEGQAEVYLYKQYKKFFSEDFNLYRPNFIDIPDDCWVEY